MHYLRASPVGIQQEQERAVILQMVSDIQAASSEQLILLDLEVHTCAAKWTVSSSSGVKEGHEDSPTSASLADPDAQWPQ